MPRSKRKRTATEKAGGKPETSQGKSKSAKATKPATAVTSTRPIPTASNTVAPSALDLAAAKKAAKAKKAAATKAVKAADKESAAKAKAMAFERSERVMMAPTKKADIVHPLRKKVTVDAAKAVVSVGDYVQLEDDLRPGRCVYGCKGWVREVHGVGGATTIDVLITEYGRVVKDVPVEKFHVITYDPGRKLPARALKGRRAASSMPPPPTPEPLALSFRKPMVPALEEAHTTNKSFGWRRKELGFYEGKPPRVWKPVEKARFLEEHRAMLALTGGGVMHGRRSKRSGMLMKRTTKRPPPGSCAYLAYAWGAGPNSAKRFEKDEVRSLFIYFDVV
jgi:hypothetical protein